jgi:hypothetical protein
MEAHQDGRGLFKAFLLSISNIFKIYQKRNENTQERFAVHLAERFVNQNIIYHGYKSKYFFP